MFEVESSEPGTSAPVEQAKPAPLAGGDRSLRITGLEDFECLEIMEHVGAGAFASVSRAVHRDTGKEVAVKTIDVGVETLEVELNKRMLRRNNSAIAK
eukprot:scaffold320029_cov43-Prasinocladus_malaysianus.AAC.1